MTDDELSAAIAERVMGWKPIDRRAMGWGDGPPVWMTKRAGNPTEMYWTPATDLRQAWQAAKKAGVRMTTNDPRALCEAVLGYAPGG